MSDPKTSPLGGLPPIDVHEYGGKGKDGERQKLNRRLFMQLLVVDAPAGTSSDAIADRLAFLLKERGTTGVVYADLNAPSGVGLLTWSQDPAHFLRSVRPIFADATLAIAQPRRDFTMIGRSYSTGHEPDLEFTLVRRPIENAMNEAYPWHVWYPLRRYGSFAKVEPKDQSDIMREHAQIGFSYGQAELAHDIRLACHGLDQNDNDFLIGLIGRELHPLSHLVQSMRKTKQTSEFIAKMGPFFVGHVVHRVA